MAVYNWLTWFPTDFDEDEDDDLLEVEADAASA